MSISSFLFFRFVLFPSCPFTDLLFADASFSELQLFLIGLYTCLQIAYFHCFFMLRHRCVVFRSSFSELSFVNFTLSESELLLFACFFRLVILRFFHIQNYPFPVCSIPDLSFFKYSLHSFFFWVLVSRTIPFHLLSIIDYFQFPPFFSIVLFQMFRCYLLNCFLFRVVRFRFCFSYLSLSISSFRLFPFHIYLFRTAPFDTYHLTFNFSFS